MRERLTSEVHAADYARDDVIALRPSGFRPHRLAERDVEGGTIRIRARRKGTMLHLSVEDDGVGIPESKLASLLDHGIGVSNVNERLNVLFGNEYRMWVDSRPHEGTRIEIEVPELQTELPAAAGSTNS
jgi:LytS/YehU family sensor histidine kinase